MNLSLSNKVVVVLASSKGIGKACAKEFYKEGSNVMLVGRNEDDLKSSMEEIQQLGKGRISYCKCDITNYNEIKNLVKRTHETLGKIDILINNAGGPPAGNFEEFSDEDWQSAYELTLLSYIRVIREFLPDLKSNKGRIINLTSSSMKQPITGLLLSNVFRLGVLGLTKSLAEELAEYGVLVHAIGPGRISTERSSRVDAIKAKRQGVTVEEIENASTDRILLGRYGLPEEFAKVVVFYASEACSYMTGNDLLVDGGMIRAY